MSPSPRTRAAPTALDDAAVLASVAAGDLSRLGTLFDRHAADVRRFIARLGASQGDVDDLVQATFLLAAQAAPAFRGGPARPWLFGLAANLVRTHRRTLSRMARRLAAWAHERLLEAPLALGDPSDAYEGAERVELARRALEKLSAKKREVFVMVAMEGIPADLAAKALGVPIGTVWTRLHHARLELHAALERGAP